MILKNSSSDKIKRIKTVCQKHFTKLQKMKNTKSKIKPIKIGKRLGTTYHFGYKDYTLNFRQEKVKRQIKYSEKNLTVSFVGQISQDFQNKKRINN